MAPDHLGAPHQITDASGAVGWQWNHDPFGNGAPMGAFSYELRFPGQFFDQATRLHYSLIILPPSILVLFYGTTCYKLFRGESLGRKVLIAQSVFFSFTALMMCIPFGGYYFAPFNPTGVVYLTSMDWWPFPNGWYYCMCGMSFLFVLATVAVTVAAIRNQKRLAGH